MSPEVEAKIQTIIAWYAAANKACLAANTLLVENTIYIGLIWDKLIKVPRLITIRSYILITNKVVIKLKPKLFRPYKVIIAILIRICILKDYYS